MQQYIQKLADGLDLREEEAFQCMEMMMRGDAKDVEISAFLSLLSLKGETSEEITGLVKSMRAASKLVKLSSDLKIVDTCGTGGDKFKTFNISTAAAMIAAAAGVKVAKHGNRAVTSSCGGADILEAAGINIHTSPEQVEKCMEKVGIGFMYAPYFHPATKKVMPVRKRLGIRTVFNLLGPLTSPANADIQLIGVFDPHYVEIIAHVLVNLGVERAMVVHGYDQEGNPAMDEISSIGPTLVALVENKKILIKKLNPPDFGIDRSNPQLIKAEEAIEENLKTFLAVLSGHKTSSKDKACLDIALANAGAIIYLSGKASSLPQGTEIARKVVFSGKAIKILENFRKYS